MYVNVQAYTNDYLRCKKCEVHDHVCKHAVRCPEKCVPRFLIPEALNNLDSSKVSGPDWSPEKLWEHMY